MGENIITLEEYKIQVRSFWENVKKKLLVDCADNEVYTVSNCFRDDITSEYNVGKFDSVFKKYENVNGYIDRVGDIFDGDFDDIEEDLEEFCYWNITKYRVGKNGEYCYVFYIHQTGLNGHLELKFNLNMEKEFTAEEREIYNDWLRLSGVYSENKIKIRFPYSKGDIIKISAAPYHNKVSYFICYDDSGNAISRDYFDRLCSKEMFSHIDIDGYDVFVPCYLEKVDSCEDKALDNVRKLILISDDEKIKEFVELLFWSPDESYETRDKRVRDLERKILELG